jgi:cellulose biosynthesis protein BcsQ
VTKIIAIANHKGGCGKTTLASHLLWGAAQRKIPTLGITLDEQGNLIKRLLHDVAIQADGRYKAGEFVQLLYSPNSMPEVSTMAGSVALVVVDLPPSFNRCRDIVPHMWHAPVDCREAIEGLLAALPAMKVADGGAGIFAVFNKYDTVGVHPLGAAQEALSKIKGIEVWPQTIPNSTTIQRSNEYFVPTWEVPYGKGTTGDRVMQAYVDETLRKLGVIGGKRR